MKILIAGAGIAGLAMALALRNRGIPFELVEREPSDTGRGAGMYLPGNSVRALTRLGVIDRVREIASTIDVQQIFDARGRLLNEVDLASFWRRCGGCLSLSRSALRRALSDALAETPVRYGRSVVLLQRDSAGTLVTFSDGTRRTYDLVIGADGIQSTVRSAIFGQEKLVDLGIASWRTITDNRFGITGWTAMLGRKRTLLAIPVEDGKLYVYADIATPDGVFAGTPADTMRELFSSVAPPLLPIIDSLNPAAIIHAGRLREVPAQPMYKRGVVLIGDAAHATSPSMAQGAGMALEDALVLAEVLSETKNVEAALTAFSARRLGRIQWVQKQGRKRDAVRSLPGPVRNFILSRFGTGLYAKSFGPLLEEI
ncbi:MAG: FAD-dependent monooxygenase [Sphingomonas sp.]|jgi:2-polyprenyl-6-methoxyphenol hydroxylase-like FAD-dependent oxidoreductase|uniref:FAD-dependent monooxygenase n=1 Tax=Sphingomonas sp. TaxID=28214 RepID=UPI0035689DE0